MHLTDQERQSWDEKGYFIRKALLPPDVIEEMRTATEECSSDSSPPLSTAVVSR